MSRGYEIIVTFIKYIYEAITAKKCTFKDDNVGLLRRVGGYWRIEEPFKTLGVSVKISGSDRFGPDKSALKNYKKYAGKFELVWDDTVDNIKKKIKNESPNLYNSTAKYYPLEIIFGSPKGLRCDMTIAFRISTVEDNEFYVSFFEGNVTEFGAMYCVH